MGAPHPGEQLTGHSAALSVAGPLIAAGEERFTAFGPSHRGALVLLLIGCCLAVLLGRALRERDPRDRTGKVLAAVALCFTLPLQILYFTPAYWDFQKTLPLQLCDLASFVSAYALWSHRPWATALTYFWGLTLTTQAILTPDLAADFPDPVFLLYWGMHLMIVWAAVYLTWGRGVRPDWHGYRVAVAVTAVWMVCILGFNLIADTNYGYLNGKPAAASILDYLGPWPWYLLSEIAIVAAVWALATWPWTVRTRARERAAEARPIAVSDS